jgi:uroporphyrinogen decarboxylase
MDAAILFSDILTIPDAMGLGLYFSEGEGPRFHKTVRTAADVEQLPIPDMARDLGYVTDAVSLIRRELNGSVPLIGFSGSPWTLATYMIEGSGSKDFRHAKAFMYNQPEQMHLLLDKLAQSVTAYLNAQIAAGAQAVQIFDTWGGILTTQAYREFSLAYMKKIVAGLTRESEGRKVPVILFTKNGGLWLQDIADSGCDCVGLDWTIEIGRARSLIGSKVSLQGNMDPSILYSTPDSIRAEVRRILASYGTGSGHVFNLGHGITPDVDPANVSAFVDVVHEYSAKYHR